MNRFLCFTLAGSCLLAGLAGCGDDDTGSGGTTGSTSAQGGEDGDEVTPQVSCASDTSKAFVRPFEVDAQAYPFTSCAFETGQGRMHFFDEGPRDAKETLLMVHGNPTWSFLYRHVATAMIAQGYRVIAIDHLGMGMSDAPDPTRFDYRPRSQSANLEAFVVAMGLQNVTLVVQDWGGPIGLGVATRRPELFSRLLILNTWAWSIDPDNPGRDHGLVTWGKLATQLYQSDPLFGCNAMLTTTADALARANDPGQGATYEQIRDAYLSPAMDPSTQKPLSTEDCAAMSTMAISILGDDAFQGEVASGLAKLQGKPYALVSGLRDGLFGALRCDPNAASLCPAGATCKCDPDYDETKNNCSANPLGDARVCKLQGAVIEQELDQWVERLGASSLVARVGDPTSGHMIQEDNPDAVIDALGKLLAVPAR